MPLEDLCLWAAHLARRQRDEELKWEGYFLGLCGAIFAAASGGKFDAAVYFPQTHARSGAGRISGPDEIREALTGYAQNLIDQQKGATVK